MRQDTPTPRPLLICADHELLEEMLRLCAAAGVEPEVAGAAGGRWSDAPLVLVGGDCAEAVAATVQAGIAPRRAGVILVSADLDDAQVWRRAVTVGAERVAFVPDADAWLVDRLADLAEGRLASGTVVAVVGGRGGGGASTLAVGLAVAAVQHGHAAVLVDADPLGGGIDLAVGAEDQDGLRWSGLADLHGRLSPSSIAGQLPALGDLTVVSWDRDTPDLEPAAMASLLGAAAAAADVVVVDCPRWPDPATRIALARASTTLLVVPAEVRACAAAGRVATWLEAACGDVRLVVRGPGPARLSPAAVGEALDLPVAAYLRSESVVAHCLERGEPPGRRPGALAKVAGRLIADLMRGPLDVPA